jgi:metastasis-associated protein MTA
MCADYVYFETSSSSPYQIRRIEELNKTPSGNVEAKVMCFYRRRDLPTPLVQLADKHQSEYQLIQLIILTCMIIVKIFIFISSFGIYLSIS